MLTLPDHKNLRDETNWLSALIDGEGCVYVGVSTRKHTVDRIDCWLQIGMTHMPTIELAATIMAKLSGDPCRVRRHKPQHDSRGYRNRGKWNTATSSKMGTLRILNALLPFLYTKQLEARLAIQFLERAVMAKKYQATKVDLTLVDVIKRLKRGDGEAPVEAMQLLHEVIPNQAILGLGMAPRDGMEGLQTTRVSPNNNPSHECPTTTEDESVH